MTRQRLSDGYAMLAVLLVMVLAATFALVVVGAVHSLQVVEGADAAGWRADAAEGQALSAATRALRWRPSGTSGTETGGDPATRESWGVSWMAALSVAGDAWPRVAAQVFTSAGRGSRRQDLVLELRTEPWAMGVTCTADADISAPLTVSGSGVYVGGCLRGRENVAFVAEPGSGTPLGAPADAVRGDAFTAAAVHGGAGIFARGVEIHESGGTGEFPDDTDRHVGLPVPEGWLAGPSVEFLLAAKSEVAHPGQALTDQVLRLDEIPPADAIGLAGGRCLLIPPMDEVTIEGSSAPDAGRLLIVVQGDAVIGSTDETLMLAGALVVSGRLEVRGPVVIQGALHASSLSVVAPASIITASSWREYPLPGAALPTLLEWGS
jgi:hypothetical protein